MRIRRPTCQIVVAAVGCVLSTVVVGVVATALDPEEEVNLAGLVPSSAVT